LGFVHYGAHVRLKKYFYDDHFPSLFSGRNCLLALLQNLYTILVAPKVKYKLHNTIYKLKDS
jgi:hypothetical protein